MPSAPTSSGLVKPYNRFRFVVWTEASTGTMVHQELYDHQSDPHETVNVADRPSYASQLKDLSLRHRNAFGLE